VNEFNEEPNETHYAKTDSRGDGDFLELCGHEIKSMKKATTLYAQ